MYQQETAWCITHVFHFVAWCITSQNSLSEKVTQKGELIVYQWSVVIVHTFKLEYLWSQLANLDYILCVASLGWGKGCMRFWGKTLVSMATERPHWLFLVVFGPILFILAGNEDMHKISDEVEFRPDWITDYGVSCPWVSKKFPIDLQWENTVSMLTRSFLIESSSKLLVTRTGVKARTSLILGRIRLLTLELLALEWWKFYTFELEYLWGQLVNFDQILCVASLGWGKAA